MSESVYKRIDRGVYRAERGLVVVSLVVMAVVVFFDVVHRSFSGEQSKFAAAVSKMAGWFGTEIVEGTARYQQLVDAAPIVMFVVFTGLTYFGIRSTKRATPISAPVAAVGAVGGVLVAYGLVRLLLVVLPNGLIWSQNMALVLTLWVGFIGASMCSYEGRHLRVEAVQRHLPDKWRPAVGFVSGLLTTTVCLVLLWLSMRYIKFNYQEFSSTDGKGGLVPGTEIPKYLGFSALPLAFGFMAVRFGAKALAALRGEVETPLDPVAAAGGAPPPPDSLGRMPSEVATEALPAPIELELDRKQSAIDTINSNADLEARKPQSQVPTDAHKVLPRVASSMGWKDFEPGPTKEIEEGPIPLADESDDSPDNKSSSKASGEIGTVKKEDDAP